MGVVRGIGRPSIAIAIAIAVIVAIGVVVTVYGEIFQGRGGEGVVRGGVDGRGCVNGI